MKLRDIIIKWGGKSQNVNSDKTSVNVQVAYIAACVKKKKKKIKEGEGAGRSGGKRSFHCDEVLEKSKVLPGCTKRSMAPATREVIVLYFVGNKTINFKCLSLKGITDKLKCI